MGLIGTHTLINGVDASQPKSLWDCLKEFSRSKPTWGTCAGMILLADKCVGTSAVIEDGQSLIGGIDITVCRNYFGSQVSSFEMETPAPPRMATADTDRPTYPGVFIRAPAILSAAQNVEILGRVVATPCRQAAVTLQELERKISAGEDVVKLGVVDALQRDSAADSTVEYRVVMKDHSGAPNEEKKDGAADDSSRVIVLPGAADGTNAREVICAVRKGHLLCTAFHPELTDDHRWHDYFMRMVEEAKSA
jgi:pyridoxal 5'-phosphate synthase pdxT subunit